MMVSGIWAIWGTLLYSWTFVRKYFLFQGHHPTMGAHEKFTDYTFDVSEFLKLVKRAVDHVMKHSEYRAAKRRLYKPGQVKDEL